jgi:uncharacterized protein (DUF1330 family)
MAAYLVLMQEVHDIGRYGDEYLPGLRPLLTKHGAEILVAGFDAEPAEGERPVKEICFSITSRGQAVVAPEFMPVG